MRTALLLRRNLSYYRRTNLVIVVGVATAVSVLAGALLVGDSVRASLRDLFLSRLGSVDYVITAPGFFREELAAEVLAHDRFGADGFAAACPLIALDGTVTHEQTGRRAAGVVIYGVDERFWQFHGAEAAAAAGVAPRNRELLPSPSLARELGIAAGDALLVRVEKPSAIPAESLHGRKDDLGRTLRLTAREPLPAALNGEFSTRPQQAAVRALFVPLQLLQKEVEQAGRINTLLVSEREADGAAAANTTALEEILREQIALEDLGIRLRELTAAGSIALESDSAILSDALAETGRAAASRLGMRTSSILSYLANSIRSRDGEIPYSVVTALDDESYARVKNNRGRIGGGAETGRDGNGNSGGDDGDHALVLPPLLLNDWAARDLNIKIGEEVSLEYFLWEEDGRLVTQSARFHLAAIVPVEGAAGGDRELVPQYPGITGSESLADWDPPFPLDLARVRPRDEEYWDRYRTTPKAFLPLAEGQKLWRSRFGKLTSLRIAPPGGGGDGGTPPFQTALNAYRRELLKAIDPLAVGFVVYPARAEGLAASRGATDFGEYFLYFSFFLVASALLLTAMFFKLNVEQRLREIGILKAIGFPTARIRTIFLGEAIMLALAGSLLGLVGAIAYGRLMMFGLRTWWVGAVGTTALRLHITPLSLAVGGVGGVVVALCCIVLTFWRLAPASPRPLLTGAADWDARAGKTGTGRAIFVAAAGFTILGLIFLLAAVLGWIGEVPGFFGGGALFLIALLCYQAMWLRGHRRRLIAGNNWWAVARLGFRNTTHRPGRSVLCIALIAFAAFIIVAVDAFRRDDRDAALERKSGTGGFSLLAESLLPLIHDPNTPEGREAMNLSAETEEEDALLSAVAFARFRVRPGDDASCLNLFQPRNPRILAPTPDFIRSNRFSFQSSLARTAEEKENPWLLLDDTDEPGIVPVIADANSLNYVLHLKLGDELILNHGGVGGGAVAPLRLRIVGALADSVFQGELLMSEKNFLRYFPEQEGYRFFLLDAPAGEAAAAPVIEMLEDRLADYGFDIVSTRERLANYHRVENTFLSTFQMLGGLGLILGTLGLAAVLLRNVLERRRELALLRAVGYDRRHFAVMVIAENALLLLCGVVTGTGCALLAITPPLIARGGHLPTAAIGLLLVAITASGLFASLVATLAVLRAPLLPTLRAE